MKYIKRFWHLAFSLFVIWFFNTVDFFNEVKVAYKGILKGSYDDEPWV